MHWKKFLLVIHKILRLFVNTLTVDEKHYLLNRDHLTKPIQIEVSKEEKTFSTSFFAFLSSLLNFKHLTKKMTLIADVFLEIPAPKKMVRSISEKPCFRGPLDRRQGKWVKTL